MKLLIVNHGNNNNIHFKFTDNNNGRNNGIVKLMGLFDNGLVYILNSTIKNEEGIVDLINGLLSKHDFSLFINEEFNLKTKCKSTQDVLNFLNK